MIGCTENNWEKDLNTLPFKLNVLLPGEPKEALKEESRRLFYVGLTRARKHLEISFSSKNDKDKHLMKSLFVEEILESNACELKKTNASKADLIHFFDYMLKSVEKKSVKLFEQDFVKKEIENFRLSATNLNSYLKCPVTFFYQSIIRVPSSKNDSMTFGSAIHFAIDKLYVNMSKIRSESDAIGVLISEYSSEMNANRESFIPANFDRRLFYGKDILTRYFKHYSDQILNEQNIETELTLNNCEIDGVPIRGQIDKLIINEGKVHVVDFKTGQYKYGKSKVNPPISLIDNPQESNFEKRYGGDYWRQILFYKALIESNKSKSLEVISGEIDFIEPVEDEYKKHKIVFNNDDYLFVRNQIKETYKRIQNLEFTEGCNNDQCFWCEFDKYN
jgi:DNA helicase-2/ATP-dependent DNA helicase PcrA